MFDALDEQNFDPALHDRRGFSCGVAILDDYKTCWTFLQADAACKLRLSCQETYTFCLTSMTCCADPSFPQAMGSRNFARAVNQPTPSTLLLANSYPSECLE